MQLEAKKILEDIRLACEEIFAFTDGKTFQDYQQNSLLQSGVERQFEIIGEALSRLVKTAPEAAGQISHYKRIISFRNILIHGYDIVEDAVVWDIMTSDLPLLHNQALTLLGKNN
ncbi:MAG: HepT-like ribonuclease domain-containing protein [Phycisphaerae bacterium]|jgi:uncharacterized protein with HEPN domain